MDVLIVAPHPDDEVLGCGGTIARRVTDGADVGVCIVTDAYTPDWSEEYLEAREREIDAVADELDIETVRRLGFPTAKLDTVPRKEINEAITEVVNSLQPEEVFLPHPSDLHHDHRIVFEAGLVATRPHQQDVDRIFAYETVSETEWGHEKGNFSPDHYVNISDFLDRKIDAMKAYETELREAPHPRSMAAIKALARKRGSEVACESAEAFTVVRSLQR